MRTFAELKVIRGPPSGPLYQEIPGGKVCSARPENGAALGYQASH